jgi:signal recognition particle subunit SRP19
MATEHDKRVIIYPNYIDSKKKVSEGRRIPLDKACDSPHVGEIADSCNKGLGLKAEPELKFYSRDFLIPGRVRVQLFQPDGKPCNPDIPNRRALMMRVAQLVPKHPGRSEKAKAAAAKAAAATQQLPAASSSKGGKKGKKGRK